MNARYELNLIYGESRGDDDPDARGVEVWHLPGTGYVLIVESFKELTGAQFFNSAQTAIRAAIAVMDAVTE